MEYSYQNQNSYHEELPALLTKFYSAAFLRWLYAEIYCKVTGEAVPKKPPRKDIIVEKLVEISQSKAKSKDFIDALPTQLKVVINRLLWVSYEDGVALQEELKCRIFNPVEVDRWGSVSFDSRAGNKRRQAPLSRSMELVVSHPPIHYYSSHEAFPANSLSLPPALRKWFRPYFPKPKGYDFESYDALVESSDWLRFDGHSDCMRSLTQIADFIGRGALKVGKNGKPSAATLRQLVEVSGARECYPREKAYTGLHLLRHEVLLYWMLEYSKETWQSFVDGKIDPKKFFRSILEELSESIEYIYERLLPHIKVKNGWSPFDPDGEQNMMLERAIREIFGSLPVGTWVSRTNLQDFRYFRDIPLQPLRRYCFWTTVRQLDDRLYGTSARKIEVDHSNFEDLILKPLLDGICFFLSAFGILEIAHQAPVNSEYTQGKKDYLTPFEGILALRLTPVGAFALGKTEKLTIQKAKVQRCELHFHPQRLHLRVQNPDPVTEKALDEYLQRLGPGHYQFSRAAIIGSASTMAQFKGRVASFKQQLGSDLPENWKNAISSVEKEPAALSKQTAAEVFTVSDAPGLREAFASDLKLRALCTRAENWQIIVDGDKVNQLQKRLQALGFICK